MTVDTHPGVVELFEYGMFLHEQRPSRVGVNGGKQEPCWLNATVHHGMAHNHGIGLLDVVRRQAGSAVVEDEQLHLGRGNFAA